MRSFGAVWRRDKLWMIEAEPHVADRFRSIFRLASKSTKTIEISANIANCVDLQWFLLRYPMLISPENQEFLNESVASYKHTLSIVDGMLDSEVEGVEYPMALPPRSYQISAAKLWETVKSYVLADPLGLGKTISAITGIAGGLSPAVVVCPPGLRWQWWKELSKFTPGLKCHVVSSSSPYRIPEGTDVLVISYLSVFQWSEYLRKFAAVVVFDEVHNLRRADSQKYRGCKSLADSVDFKLGMSGTPIQNYGIEAFNIYEVLRPGFFGTKQEFQAEWCGGNGKFLVNPQGFGSYLREHHLMLRRERSDVGRELPPETIVTQHVKGDQRLMSQVDGQVRAFSKQALSGDKSSQTLALQQLSSILRKATGVAKARQVAEFVEELIESGEPVMLVGWHRDVYDIWLERLMKYRPAMLTGSETSEVKRRQMNRFASGETDLLIVSLRSAEGLDGIQERCKTLVIGELDWNPKVHDQCIGRVSRDRSSGELVQPTVYYMITDVGIDSDMADLSVVKVRQSDGVLGLKGSASGSGAVLRKVAQRYAAS